MQEEIQVVSINTVDGLRTPSAPGSFAQALRPRDDNPALSRYTVDPGFLRVDAQAPG